MRGGRNLGKEAVHLLIAARSGRELARGRLRGTCWRAAWARQVYRQMQLLLPMH